MTHWRYGMYHLLPVCHVNVEVRIKFSASVHVNYVTFLKLLCILASNTRVMSIALKTR
jgi:hypothetical protein